MQIVAEQRIRKRLSVRLASRPGDIEAVQRLRYTVFHDEMGATPSPEAKTLHRDIDEFDSVCDHLMVEDSAGDRPRVVGTYRLLRQSVAFAQGGLYTAREFDLSAPLRHAAGTGQELLELGRSCVEPAYRDSGTIQLLWRGIAAYLRAHSVGHLIGCASFPGTDPARHADAIAYLHHQHLAPVDLRAAVHPGMRAKVAMPPLGGYDPRIAMRQLPPLIKAYLRVGAMVGDGAFVDRRFNTVDVFLIMPVDRIASRYSDRFGAAA